MNTLPDQCSFCEKVLKAGDNINEWQYYAVVVRNNWVKFFCCPACKKNEKKRIEAYKAKLLREQP